MNDTLISKTRPGGAAEPNRATERDSNEKDQRVTGWTPHGHFTSKYTGRSALDHRALEINKTRRRALDHRALEGSASDRLNAVWPLYILLHCSQGAKEMGRAGV